MISDRIKDLRELNNMTQAELARQLGITRSSVNAWEIGISIPSTQYIVELAQTFGVSTDYLLCVESTATISVSGLDEDDLRLVSMLVNHLKQKNLKS